jgi:hypothetical protein
MSWSATRWTRTGTAARDVVVVDARDAAKRNSSKEYTFVGRRRAARMARPRRAGGSIRAGRTETIEDDIVAIPRAVSTPRGHAIARARRSTAPVSRAAPRRWRPLAERDAVPDARVTPRPKRAGDGPSDGV